jgi:hypothetical protein
MIKINDEDIVLFATNTGELYPTHLRLARAGTPVNAGSSVPETWLAHVTGPVLALYGKQVEPANASAFDRFAAARELKEYYERHFAWGHVLGMMMPL